MYSNDRSGNALWLVPPASVSPGQARVTATAIRTHAEDASMSRTTPFPIRSLLACGSATGGSPPSSSASPTPDSAELHIAAFRRKVSRRRGGLPQKTAAFLWLADLWLKRSSIRAVADEDIEAGLDVEHRQVVALAYRIAGDPVVDGDSDLYDLPGHIEAVGVQDPTGKASAQILISVDGHLRARKRQVGVTDKHRCRTRVRPSWEATVTLRAFVTLTPFQG